MISGLSGVNPPYVYAAKTRGVQPSDEDYQRLNEIQGDYSKNMGSLSAQAMGGQITPAQWRQQYQDITSKHAAAVETLFKHSPAYAKGTMAYVNQYEALNDQALVNGTLDFDKLDQLQQAMRQQHSAAENAALDAELSKNEQAYPMLHVYKQTIRSYQQWQEHWASQNGVDVGSLRADVAQYGSLYGNQRASQEFLRNHKDVALYERAKQREWEQSPQGLVWGLFYNSPTVSRYLAAKKETPEQAIQKAGLG